MYESRTQIISFMPYMYRAYKERSKIGLKNEIVSHLFKDETIKMQFLGKDQIQ